MSSTDSQIPHVSLGGRPRHGHPAPVPSPSTDVDARIDPHHARSDHPQQHPVPSAALGVGDLELEVTHLDVQFDPDDPSDAVLAVTVTVGGDDDEHVVEYPLTEMKAAKLRAGLAAQQSAVADARHVLLGEPAVAQRASAAGAVHGDTTIGGNEGWVASDSPAQDDNADEAADNPGVGHGSADPRTTAPERGGRKSSRLGRTLGDPLVLDAWTASALTEADDSDVQFGGITPSKAVMYVIIGFLGLMFVGIFLTKIF